MAVASLGSCVKEVPAPTPNPRPDVQEKKDTVLTPVSFEARLGESRSSVWDGEVLIYDNVAKHEGRKFEASQISGTRAVLTGEAYYPVDMYYAVYPADAFGAFSDGKVGRDIPVNQVVKAEDAALAPEAQVAFAQALSTQLRFSPVTAYVSFTVKAAEVKSFTLRAAGEEDIAGQTDIDIYSNEINLIGGEKTITVTPEGREIFESKTYSVEVFPAEYKNGFVVELTFKDGSTYTNTFPEPLELSCGGVVNVGNLTDLNIYAPVVKVEAAAFTDAKISWEEVTTADGYKVYANGTLVATLGKEVLSYTVTDLANESNSIVKVEAYNDRKAASTEVTATTKGLRKNTKSTGTTFLCIDWDSVCKTRNDGYEQAYQVQIFEDASCTSPVYDFVPYDGQKQVNPSFGNSSYFGQTKEPQDGIKCDNYLTPTRVSIGGLYPGTTYYVRVRTLESVTVQSRTTQTGGITDKTLTNAFGTSQWSEAIAMTTDSERVLDSKAVLYCGFNDCCVQSDYKSWAPGAVPYGFLAGKSLSDCWIPWNHANRDKSIGFAFYAHGTRPQHQLNTWNLAKDGVYVNGLAKDAAKGQNYLIGRDKGSVNAITGDMAGWHFHQWCRPFMGMLGLDGDAVSVATPVIAPGQVPEAGADCTISFSAVARVRPQDNYNGTLEVRVYRAATKTFETIAVLNADKLVPYAAGSVSGEYICDFTGHVHTFTANLKPGDAVELYNTKNELVLVDDILITKGVNIDNVDRDPIEW